MLLRQSGMQDWSSYKVLLYFFQHFSWHMVRSTYLGFHVLDDACSVPWSIVVLADLTSAKDFDGWVPTNLKSVAGVLASLGTVDLGKCDRWIVSQQVLRSSVEFGLHLLAMATPVKM